MKCPKCGFISFEYNQSCPKCNRDITAEAKKLNLPTYRPNPPSLLGALTGEADESYRGLLRRSYGGEESEKPNIGVRMDDSTEIGTDAGVFDDGKDLDISLDTGEFEVETKPEEQRSGGTGEGIYSLDDLKVDDTGELRIRKDSNS
jgi:hypothetical protein